MTLKTASDCHPEVLKLLDNDTAPRYDPAAAQLAWKRTIDFFNAHLRG